MKKEQHFQLMNWACYCSEHVLPLFGEKIDDRLLFALKIGREWMMGNASVGEARKASVGAIAVAHEVTNPVSVAVARSIGHAVATAHMADHSMGAAWYALKAIKSANNLTEKERKWQDKILPLEIRELVISGRQLKNI